MKKPVSSASKTGVKVVGVGAALAAIVAVAAPIVQRWEGLETQAYLDAVGVPTICYGETRGVRLGDEKTAEECRDMLDPRLKGFLVEMRNCTSRELPVKTEAAFLSFTYNLGSGTYCRNIAEKRINAGRLEEACDAILLYNRAGGRILRGLVRRRQEEHALCMAGLDEAGLR